MPDQEVAESRRTEITAVSPMTLPDQNSPSAKIPLFRYGAGANSAPGACTHTSAFPTSKFLKWIRICSAPGELIANFTTCPSVEDVIKGRYDMGAKGRLTPARVIPLRRVRRRLSSFDRPGSRTASGRGVA